MGSTIIAGEALAFHQPNLRTRFADYGEFLQQRILPVYAYATGAFIRAQQLRQLLRQRANAIFDQVDLLSTPTIPHVALAVEDIQEAQKELGQRGIWYWRIQGLVGQYSDQVFVRDPFGNVIELHQIGTCRCNKAAIKE